MNLQQRRRLWYAVHDIPADVRPLFGDKLKFVQSLKTPDKNIAKAKAAALEAEWRTKIDIARGKATVEDDSYWITRAKAATSATEKKAVMSALGAQVFDKEEALYEQHGDSYTETDEYKRLERLQGIASGQIVALDSHVDEWIGTLSDQKKSKDMKKATVLRFVAAGFATVQDVQRKAVQGWINRLASIENKAPATVQRSLSELRSYWRYLVALEIASEEPDPFEKLQLPRNVTTGDERKPFTAQQVVDLLGAAKAKRTPDPALVDLITIGMWTGARIEEICAMKIAQVEDGFLSIIDAKTAAGWRQVPIHPKLKPTIDRLKGTRRSCPREWCKSGDATSISGRFGRVCQVAATGGKPTSGSSPKGATDSRVM